MSEPTNETLLYIVSDYEEATETDRANVYKQLLSRLDRGERAIQAINKIADIVHNYSCHSAAEAYARITRIVMEYEKLKSEEGG